MTTYNRAETCAHCNKSIDKGPWFKRFCDGQCRAEYHKVRRERGLALLEQYESGTGADDAR